MQKPISRSHFFARSKLLAGVAIITAGLVCNPAGAMQFTTDIMQFGSARVTVARAPDALACPGAKELEEDLLPLGFDVPREHAVEIRIELSARADGFGAHVTVSGEQGGVRELASVGLDCSKLAGELTAVLALLLDRRVSDERAATTEVAAPQSDPSPPVVRPTAPPPRPARPTPARRDSRTMRGEFGSGAALLLVARPAAFFSGSFWLEGDAASGAATLFSTLDASAPLGSGAVDVRLMGAHVRGCGLLLGSHDRTYLRWCGALALAALRGHARDYPSSTDAAYRPWYAVGTGAAAGGPILGRVAWALDATVFLPLHRESFSIAPLGVAFKTPLIGVMVGVGARMSI